MNLSSPSFRAATLAAAIIALSIGCATARAEYRLETLVPPQMPAGDYSGALGINNSGQVLIVFWNPVTGLNDGFCVYDSGTQKYTLLPQDPDAAAGINTIYNGLNDLGQFAGLELSTTHTIPPWAVTAGWAPYQSFVYSSKGDSFDNYMPPTPDAFVSEATAINDEGVVVGVNNTGTGDQGYIRTGRTFKLIDVLATSTTVGTPGPTTDPMSINNSGEVVGYFGDPSSPLAVQGFEFNSRTGVISQFNYHGNVVTQAYGISDTGVIVGFTTDDPTQATGHGFIDVDGDMSILDYTGAVLTYLDGVDISGLISGEYQDSDEIWHAFLATPIRNSRTPIRSDR